MRWLLFCLAGSVVGAGVLACAGDDPSFPAGAPPRPTPTGGTLPGAGASGDGGAPGADAAITSPPDGGGGGPGDGGGGMLGDGGTLGDGGLGGPSDAGGTGGSG